MNQVEVISEAGLQPEEALRYSRQIILPEIGITGQLALKESSVLVVGAGGLGCPAAIYLAAAGVGTLGIVDHDVVELSNLHRQILHSTGGIGTPKAESATAALTRLNDRVTVAAHHLCLTSDNALPLVRRYRVVLDCTDNVATRYLLNDACVLADRPLVSAAALRLEGQLVTYHCDGGPCYRCLYPRPPPAETVTSCSEGGVLGVVPGIMGSLQALECIRVLVPGMQPAHADSMLLFDAAVCQFRSVKLRPRQKDCAVCGDSPSVTQLIDYTQFCGSAPTDKDVESPNLLPPDQRLDPLQYRQLSGPALLVDVRPAHELLICRVAGALSVPLSLLYTDRGVEEVRTAVAQLPVGDGRSTVVTLCRRGNDSQLAARLLQSHLAAESGVTVCDIRGGLYAWQRELEPNMLLY